MQHGEIHAFLTTCQPYDALPPAVLEQAAREASIVEVKAGEELIALGQLPTGIHLVRTGGVELRDETGHPIAHRGPGDRVGDRPLLRGQGSRAQVVATADSRLIFVPEGVLRMLMADFPAFARFLVSGRKDLGEGLDAGPRKPDLATLPVSDIMTPDPALLPPGAPVRALARIMQEKKHSCVLLGEGRRLDGILTAGDMVGVLAQGIDGETPGSEVMTTGLRTLAPTALGLDALHMMAERRIGHLPVVDNGKLLGIVTQTDLVRREALSAAHLVGDIARKGSAEEMIPITAAIPGLLAQLVAQGARPEAITRMITDIADAATRRLLTLAEETIGPAPVPWLWLACGSQGRQEQTGVSDQDNCLILSDDYVEAEHGQYFKDFAEFVCDGLNEIGYVYCPGDMMASNARWRQPVRVWRSYFEGWVRKPDPMAQMLASVMFDLRPIGGDESLFTGLQAETLEMASKNTIFVAHMTSNSLKHTVPLGLFRGFALVRSGEHKNTLDLKHNGVVPVVDLGRLYALIAKIEAAGTRARLIAAKERGAASASGIADLLDAYDMIAETRLRHQAAQVRRGEKPDNFMDPTTLSELERNHLKDAFGVIRTMQSGAASGRGGGLM
ncbi:DUF294 nucleotidyltransferase-like domain-containing protein [Rhodovulum sp. DZ06]|uniref:DUF294 nucleotidyltransferase-like domain-containing protein n=1 Tax=Rhodovulum sp. DZ06 TaxID=3425126 RepID=UPI003D33A649